MAVGSPPTVRRRKLGRELRRLREESGLLAEDLASRLRCSPSRISRIETARVRITPGTVHDILDALGINGPERRRLVSLAREANGKKPANAIWLWGQGKAPALTPFRELYGLRGAIISALIPNGSERLAPISSSPAASSGR